MESETKQKPSNGLDTTNGYRNDGKDAEKRDLEKLSEPEVEIKATTAAPPDGGWGWVVCFAAFVSMVILDGMMFSFGVLFLELQEFFQEGKGKTAMVGSALMGIHLIAGPITSALVNAWGVRPVAMAGSIIATLAFACSTMSSNITQLTLLYGFLGGIGVSMIYLPSIIAVGFYFEKRRALANGITQSGSGIGTFIYSPLSNILLLEYGWKGTTLILSGLVLNCLTCAAFYRPLPSRARAIEVPQKQPERDTTTTKDPDLEQQHFSNGSLARERVGSLGNNAISSKTVAQMLLLGKGQKHNNPLVNSVPLLASSSSSTPNTPKVKHRHRGYTGVSTTDSTGNLSTSYKEDNSLKTSLVYSSEQHLHSSNREDHHLDLANKPLYKKDLFYSGSLQRIPEYRLQKAASLYSIPQIVKEAASHTGNTPQQARHGWSGTLSVKLTEFGLMMKHMMGFGLFNNKIFILTMLSMVLWTTHSTILTLLPDFAVTRGVSRKNASYLLSIIGCANTAARVLAGWLSDRPGVDCVYVNVGSLLVGGVSCIAMAVSSHWALFAVESAVFGICMGTWTSLRPIILVDLLGLDNLTNAFGLVAMFQGLAFLVGPPIAGSSLKPRI